VAGQIVGDHHVSRAQRGAEELPHVHEQGFSIHWAVKHHRRGQRIHTQPRNKRRRFPMPVRNAGDTTLADGSASITPRHVRAGASFVKKHQLGDVEFGLPFLPGEPRRLDVLALLLAGVQGFF
jgi:hypothetical protein